MTNRFTDKVMILAMAAAQGVFILPKFFSDTALAAGHANGTNPYSILWFLMNPGFWTQLPYKVYLLGMVWIMTFVYLKLYDMGKMGFLIIWLWELQNAVWWSFTITENITVTLFAPLAIVVPWLALLPLLQKIPWGWSWNLSDLHWHCAFSWPGNWIAPFPECNAFDRWGFGLGGGLVYTYIMILVWTVVPVAIWAWRRRKAS